MIKIAIADDHKLIRESIVEMLKRRGFDVLGHAGNGKELIEILSDRVPDVVLLDIRMPVMDGFETAKWLKKHMPQTKFIGLSSMDYEEPIIRMLRLGAGAFVPKDADTELLENTIKQVYMTGSCFSEDIAETLIRRIESNGKEHDSNQHSLLTLAELQLVEYLCSEMTYAEIAVKMNFSVRTIESKTRAICDKLKVKNRIGVVLYAIKNDVIKLLD